MGGGCPWLTAWCVAALAAALHYVEFLGYNRVLTGLTVTEQKVASLRTENAFYFSYYEETVAAPTTSVALWRVLRDDRSEAPDSINALYRFNIYQEFIVGLSYRLLRGVVGEESAPDPWHFFRHSIYALNGVGQGALVLLAAGCGGGGFRGAVLPGAILTLLSYLHRADTGRMLDVGMLNLRENWAMPMIWCQVLCLQRFIANHPEFVGKEDHANGRATYRSWRWAFRICTSMCLILWQFSAFAFLLQVSAIFLAALLACDIGSRRVLEDVVTSTMMAVAIAAIFLFGNELLVHHMLVTQCVAIVAVLRWRRDPPRARVLLFWLDGALAVGLFLLLRLVQMRFATAEEHIGELFAAKIRQIFPRLVGKAKEPTFNARLYLAVSVFDFISYSQLTRFIGTGVYAFAAIAAALFLVSFFRRVVPYVGGNDGVAFDGTAMGKASQVGMSGDIDSGSDNPVHKSNTLLGEIGFGASTDALRRAVSFGYCVLLSQTLFFAALGCFIARLKVLGAPSLLVLASTATTPLVLDAAVCPCAPVGASWLGYVSRHATLGAGALAQLAYVAYLASRMPFVDTNHLVAVHRDHTWPEVESGELFDWMVQRLPANTTVLTSMPLSAELRLNAPFRVVIHPQFEAKSLRDRVQDTYIFYQCTPPGEFVKMARVYGATHFILEYKRCSFSPFILDNRPDLNCKEGKTPWTDLFCPRAHTSPYFEMLFANAQFVLFRIRESPRGRSTSLHDIATWRPMLKRCMQEEPLECPTRTLELSIMFSTKLKQPQVGESLLKWAKESAPDDGLVHYTLGRYYDYDLQQLPAAKEHYRRALELEPNNPLIFREYLLFVDTAMRDTRALEAMMRPRRNTHGDRLSILALGDVYLACEASVTAFDLFRDLDWQEDLWAFAVAHGHGSECVKNNWQLIHSGNDMYQSLGNWPLFLNVFWHHRMRSYLGSTSGTYVRWWQRPRREWNVSLKGSFGTDA